MHGFYWVIFRFPTIRITLEECLGAVTIVVKKCFPFLMNLDYQLVLVTKVFPRISYTKPDDNV